MKRLSVVLLCSLLGAVPTAGLEVDPYLAWLEDIPDSSEVLNGYVNAMVSGHLQSLDTSGRVPNECSDAAVSVLKHMHLNVLSRRRALRFLKTSPDIESWKGGGVWSSVWRSYYRRLPFLYVSSLARTIDLNGIRLSVDKVGHFFSYGRRYYKRYLRAVERGETSEEAERGAILYGLKQENLFVGKWIDTIFSHADLEANYQGLRFARDLCEGEEAYLERVDGVWVLARDVDLRDYVNPAFDEGFNNNHFTRLGWRLVRTRLAQHCQVLELPRVRARLAYYRGFPGPSTSQRVIREVFEIRGKDPQAQHSLEALCAPPS